jgi:hypothetical protein
MSCQNIPNFRHIEAKKNASYKTHIKDIETPKDENLTPKKKFRSETIEDCAQFLNEDFFLLNSQKKFTEQNQDQEIDLNSNLERLVITKHKKSIEEDSLTHNPIKENPRQHRNKELLDLIENKSLIASVKETLKSKRIFKSPCIDQFRFKVRGKLFKSRSRIKQIKKNLKRTKLQRKIHKPNKKIRIRPLQKKLINREYLRKRKRDMSDLQEYAHEVNCCRCNILILYSKDPSNKDFFWKTGENDKIRVQDKFFSYDKLCKKCEKKQSKSRFRRSETLFKNDHPKKRKDSFTDWNYNDNDEELEENSKDSIVSNLSEISLQNSKIKRNFKFKFEEIKTIKKKKLQNVNKEQFVCSSTRGTTYFPFYRKEGDKLKFEANLDDKLHNVNHDEDYDTDEELIDKHINAISSFLIKGIRKANRRKI